MSDAIWTAIITGGLMLIGNIFVSIISNSKTLYRIEQLEKKQDRYNNIQERLAVTEKDIKHIYHEIDEIKEEK